MKWYSKYLSTYGTLPDDIPEETVNLISSKLKLVNNDNPIVSVVVIAYNEEKNILSSLWSLSENRCKYPFEIIVVDNNSQDGTKNALNKISQPFFEEARKGPGNARNKGLSKAKGQYIVCIDSDTLYPPYYIETMVTHLERLGIVGVFSLWSYVPNNKYPRFKMLFYELIRDIHLIMLSFRSPERCVRGMVFAHRTDLAKIYGYKTNIRRGEDGYLAYQLKNHGKLKLVISRKARPYTSTSTLTLDGTILEAIKKRLATAIKGYRKYFYKTSGEIKDQESNLLK